MATSIFIGDDMDGGLTVYYQCEPTENETSEMTLSLEVTQDHNIVFRWLKVCGSGTNDKVQITYVKETSSEQSGDCSTEPKVIVTNFN